MKPYEHLLVCLGEEGSEVAQACSKALRFGLNDQVTLDPTGPRGTEGPTNIERLADELNDLYAVAQMLVMEGVLPKDWFNLTRQAKKIDKVTAFMHYADQCGTIQPEKIAIRP